MLHTDIPTRDDLQILFDSQDPASVSIYVATTPVSIDIEASRIELKNLASSAARELRAADIDKRSISAIGAMLDDLIDDTAFLTEQANSLAVFVTPDGIRTFRLPSRIGSTLVTADRFHLKPLLRAVTFPHAAFLLALAQNSVRLLELSPDLPVWQIEVDGMPRDAASAVGKASIGDRSPSRRIQGSEGQKVRLAQYARQVDRAIRSVVSGSGLPLILAASDPLDVVFRSVSTYPHLVQDSVPGNPEGASDADLAAAARPILDSLYAQELASVRERFDELRSRGRASSDLVDVARAATFGAVDTVLVDIDRSMPGSVDETTGALTLQDEASGGTYGVVDEIARRTFRAGGRVLAVRGDDVPEGAAAAALLRYPI